MESPKDEEAVIAIQHPLENSVILDLVLVYFQPLATFKDWKSIRAVSKTWYLQTLSKWRVSAFLNLKLGLSLHRNQPGSSGVLRTEFLALMENEIGNFSQFREKPFQKYKVQNLVFDVFKVKENSLFLASVGPSIKHLSLNEVNIKTRSNSTTEVMEFLVKHVPNLESFSVSNVYIGGKRISKPPRITVLYPHVKTLRISNCFAFGFKNFPNLQEVILISCESNDMANLVNPNPPLVWEFVNTSVQRLELENWSMGTPDFLYIQFAALKSLSLLRNFGFNDSSALSDFITNHKETLETIEAFGTLIKSSPRYNFIRKSLPNLTELRAWGNVFSDLTFIRHTQNLKLLHLDLYGFEKQKKMREYLSACPLNERWYLPQWDPVGFTHSLNSTLRVINPVWQYMHYFQINYELKEQSFERLANWMPNLKTLKTVLNKDTFPVLCENFPKLEHLECLFGSNILNESITGIREGSSTGKSSKALVDMDCLITFKFHTECNKSLLSDDSVASGFLLVSKLTTLSICVSSEFSKDAEIQLRRGFSNVQVYRNYSSNPLHKNWQCCQDTEYKNFLFDRAEDIVKVEVEYLDLDSDSE